MNIFNYMENYVCDRVIIEELVQYGTIWEYKIGMAEILLQTIKYLSLRVKGHCEIPPHL